MYICEVLVIKRNLPKIGNWLFSCCQWYSYGRLMFFFCLFLFLVLLFEHCLNRDWWKSIYSAWNFTRWTFVNLGVIFGCNHCWLELELEYLEMFLYVNYWALDWYACRWIFFTFGKHQNSCFPRHIIIPKQLTRSISSYLCYLSYVTWHTWPCQ